MDAARHPYWIYLTPSVWDLVEQEAHAWDVSPSVIVERALLLVLGTPEGAGCIWCGEDQDLSTLQGLRLCAVCAQSAREMGL